MTSRTEATHRRPRSTCSCRAASRRRSGRGSNPAMSSGPTRGLSPRTDTEGYVEVAVQAEGLVKHYGDVEAVRGVDLRVEKGEVFGFLGPNGAGKSTTVRMLTTLLSITARHGPGRGRGRRPRPGRGAAQDRRRAAGGRAGPAPDRARAADPAGAAVRDVLARGGRAGQGAARAGRARGRRRPPHQGLQRRHEAPAGPRERARAPSPRCCSSTSRPPAWTPPAG